MANGKTPKHSGFDAPVIGEAVPKGTKFKKTKDGKYIMITPKDNKKKK